MSAKQPRQPKLRRHSSGNAFVELDRRRHYLGRWGSPEAAERYDQLIAEWLSNSRRLPAPDSLVIVELLDRYLAFVDAHYLRDGKPSPHAVKIRLALQPVAKLYGRAPASEFGPRALVAVRHQWVLEGRCRAVCNAYARIVTKAFRWAEENELVPRGTWATLRAVTGLERGRTEAPDYDPVGAVPLAHVDALRPHVSRQVWGLMQLQLASGARAGELVGLRPVDVITTGAVWVAELREHKGSWRGLTRTLFFGPRAQAVLQDFLGGRPVDAPLFSPREAMAERKIRRRAARKTPVQPSQLDRSKLDPKKQPGDAYSTWTYARAILRGCKAAGVPEFSPHRLRHTAACEARKALGLDGAQVLLGHRRADTTEIYATLDEGRGCEVALKIG